MLSFWLRGWDLKGPPQSHSRLSSPRYTRLAILLALWGIATRKRYLIVFSCSPTTSSGGRDVYILSQLNKRKTDPIGSVFLLFGCGGGIWTSRPPGYEPDELPSCSTPRYEIGAGNRARTGTQLSLHWILSPRRLPIPPLRHIASLRTDAPFPLRLSPECLTIITNYFPLVNTFLQFYFL